MRAMKRFQLLTGLSILSLSLAACSSSKSSTNGSPQTGNDGGNQGGSTSGGGSSNGGSTSGGASNGGSTSGGASNGGSTSGGASNGGASNGGSTGDTDAGATSDVDAGDSPCGHYCADELEYCTGANAQFHDIATCKTACAKYPTTGKDGDTMGDTLQCRVYHLGNAAADPGLHCPHTGVTPTAFCK
jgi:hypothetical protein